VRIASLIFRVLSYAAGLAGLALFLAHRQEATGSPARRTAYVLLGTSFVFFVCTYVTAILAQLSRLHRK